MTKREFLAAAIGTGWSLSQVRTAWAQRPPASRKAKTTKLLKSPVGFPNAIAVTPESLWIGEQKCRVHRRPLMACRNRNR